LPTLILLYPGSIVSHLQKRAPNLSPTPQQSDNKQSPNRNGRVGAAKHAMRRID